MSPADQPKDSTAPSGDAPAPAKPPVLLRATLAEVVGSSMRVAGLSVLERAIKQLHRLQYHVVLATDGSCRLPTYLPASVQVHKVPKPENLTTLRRELVGAIEVGADEVRPAGGSLDGKMRVIDEPSRRRAERAVFAELLRGDLGFVARYLNKPVSFFITRHLLCRLPFTPNQVTLGAALVGLLGALMVSSGGPALIVWGFFLAHLQSILDGCDGELARVRFQQSALGEWMDTVVDDGLNIVLFACIGVGVYRATGSLLALAAGILAAALHVGYDVIAYRELRLQGGGGEIIKVRWHLTGSSDMKTRLAKGKRDPLAMVHAIGRRDFFILAFLVYALLGVPWLALIHALLIAGPLAVVAGAQVVWRARGGR
ncbi:MAG: CDP-alcohol phosphatidyltransferase family protein [Polyangia bacterium]